MSGLIGSILSTTNALKANQVAIETAGKNMANVNNPNYSRQRLEFGISGGISASVVTQQRDAIIEGLLVSESSVTGDLEAKNKIYQQLQSILGEQITGDVQSVDTLNGSSTGDSITGGLSTALKDFFNSIQSFSSDPNDVATKSAVIIQAQELVTRFNSIATDLENLDVSVLKNVDSDLGQVNGLLNEIADLNKEIGKREIVQLGSAHEYRDLRQQKLVELAKYIDFETQEVGQGQLQVSVRDKDGVPGNSVLLVDKTRVNNTLKFNEASNEVYFSSHSQTLGNSPNASAMELSGGSLKGLLEVRSTTDPHGGASSYATGALSKMREDLDSLAQEIARQVSAVYDDAAANEFFFDDDGDPDAIDINNITAKSIQLYAGDPGGGIEPLNAASLKATATNNAGANELAIELAELTDFVSSNLRGNSFSGFVSEMATNIGFELANNNQQLENQEIVIQQLESQRAAVSGVSIDEELANMIRFQRSFEASARVLRVMDEMLELIVNGLVR